MTVEQPVNFTERRRFQRRRLNMAVSFCRREASGGADWCLGTIQDVGSGGIRVRVSRELTLKPGMQLEILCLPDPDKQSQSREPVRIQGQVVWVDVQAMCFGLQFP